MTDFKKCLDDFEVEDIRAFGPFHTWWNKQEHSPISRKLDWAVGNGHLFLERPNAEVTFLPRGLSDHSLVLLSIGWTTPTVKKPFQSFNYMLALEGYDDAIINAWANVIGSPLFILAEKLRRVEKALILLNKNQGNLISNAKQARLYLHTVQNVLHSQPTDGNLIAR